MEKAAILGAFGALCAVAVNFAVGMLTGLGRVLVITHSTIAVPTTVAALFAWTVVVFYFIGAFAWVKGRVEEERLDARLEEEAHAIRRSVFPGVFYAMLALMATYVIGGGADTGAVPWWVHLGLAIVALALHVVAAYRTVLFVGLTLDLQAKTDRVASGVAFAEAGGPDPGAEPEAASMH